MTNQKVILDEIGEAVNELKLLLGSLNDDQLNDAPFTGSWTPPQVLVHVTKSIFGMAEALQKKGIPAERDTSQRIEELRTVFLDFSTKLQTPDFIKPEEGVYQKQAVIEKLENAFTYFLQQAESANLDELVENLPLGPITKLEILHFVLYHTQRHVHQMKNIVEALKNNIATHETS